MTWQRWWKSKLRAKRRSWDSKPWSVLVKSMGRSMEDVPLQIPEFGVLLYYCMCNQVFEFLSVTLSDLQSTITSRHSHLAVEMAQWKLQRIFDRHWQSLEPTLEVLKAEETKEERAPF